MGMVAGTLNAEAAICNVVTSGIKINKPDGVVVAGPYELVCKNTSGNVIKDFNKPVVWNYNLKSKIYTKYYLPHELILYKRNLI